MPSSLRKGKIIIFPSKIYISLLLNNNEFCKDVKGGVRPGNALSLSMPKASAIKWA
jgi:hypothetical protein